MRLMLMLVCWILHVYIWSVVASYGVLAVFCHCRERRGLTALQREQGGRSISGEAVLMLVKLNGVCIRA